MNYVYVTKVLQTMLALLMILTFSKTGIAQECNSNLSLSAPDSRFQDNSDGTISDLKTGLMWQKCSIGQSGTDCTIGEAKSFTWDAALQQSKDLNYNTGFVGYYDWRLPNRNELASLIELACNGPAINLTYFPNTEYLYQYEYWTSSPAAGTAEKAYVVTFYSGYVKWCKEYRYYPYGGHVRLVRNGNM